MANNIIEEIIWNNVTFEAFLQSYLLEVSSQAVFRRGGYRMELHGMCQVAQSVYLVVPVAVLLIENEDDRRMLSQIYSDYRNIMYAVARKYLGGDKLDLDDAIGSTIARLCQYCGTVRKVPEDKRKSYIASVTGNVCRDIMRKKKRRNELFDYSYTKEMMEEIPEENDRCNAIFDQSTALELEEAFDLLAPRERTLIYMHHVDGLDIKTVAESLNISYGAARTALTRARNHLLRIIQGGETYEKGK